MTAPREVVHRVVDVPLQGGAVLRVAYVADAECGDSVVLSRGFGSDGERFHRPSWAGEPLVLPASVVPELLAALDALDALAEEVER